MYCKFVGMMGIVVMEVGEFWEIYKLDVVEILMNRFIVCDDRDDKIYKIKCEKYNVVIEEVVEFLNVGRFVLIGIILVDILELLSRMLSIWNIQYNVLNVKLYKREVDIVVEVGYVGVVIIVINMVGCGMDIKLSEEVKKVGGLVIVGIECYDLCCVDRQFCGCSGC